MAYVAKNWILSGIVMPEDMNRIEQGIQANDASIAELLSGKVDKADGKGLSANDFTDAFKTKLTNIVSPDSPTEIPSGADLNTYTSAGYFRCRSISTASTVANAPTTLAFIMQVYLATDVIQVVTDYNENRVYQRRLYEGSWSSWREIATNDWVTSNFLGKSAQAVDSAKLGGKAPSSYANASHNHPWSQVTDKPAQATRWPAWSEVTGKPSTFTPSAHTQAWSTITGKPSAYTPASHNQAWSTITSPPATATRWPSWGEVTGKPSTFAPSTHVHITAYGTSVPSSLAYGQLFILI
jgi:hypothetical protein